MRARAILIRLVLYPALLGSFLVFPAELPWMALGWLAVIAALLLKGRPSRLPGLVLLAALLVRRPDPAPGLVAFLLLLAGAVGSVPTLASRRPLASGAIGVLLVSWAVFAWGWSEALHTDRRPSLKQGRPVLCVGDSLSAGTFAGDLAELLSVAVIDHAAGGTTAAEGLAALPRSLELRPQAVLIEFGGHDYLRGRAREEVRLDLERMIRLCREAGAEPILFEIPRGFLTDGFRGLERGLAREHDLELIPDGVIRWLILRSPWFPVRLGEPLSDDGLHPNAAGSHHLAKAAAEALGRVYGPGIRSPGGWPGRVGRPVSLEGIARDAKLGALLESPEGTVWLDARDRWPDTLQGRRVRVSGVLVRRDDLPAFIREPGEPPKAGLPLPPGVPSDVARRRYVLLDPRWTLLGP